MKQSVYISLWHVSPQTCGTHIRSENTLLSFHHFSACSVHNSPPKLLASPTNIRQPPLEVLLDEIMASDPDLCMEIISCKGNRIAGFEGFLVRVQGVDKALQMSVVSFREDLFALTASKEINCVNRAVMADQTDKVFVERRLRSGLWLGGKVLEHEWERQMTPSSP